MHLTKGVGTFFYISPEQERRPQGQQAAATSTAVMGGTSKPTASSALIPAGAGQAQAASQAPSGAAASGYDEKVDLYALGIIFFEMWYPFSTAHERYTVLYTLRGAGAFPRGFEHSHPRQVRIIRWLLQEDPQQRPSALELLQSDLLPPKMEDEYMKDALRTIAHPHTSFYHRLVRALFDPSRPFPLHVTSDDFHPSRAPLDMHPELMVARVREECSAVLRRIFERHGAVPFATPLAEPVVQVDAPVMDSELDKEEAAALAAGVLAGAVIGAGGAGRSSLSSTHAQSSIAASDHDREQARVRRRRRRLRDRMRDVATLIPPKDSAVFMDQAGLLLSLRYDLRGPFTRHIVRHRLARLTRYDIGKVYRAGGNVASASGFQNQGGLAPRAITQADFDILGFDPTVDHAQGPRDGGLFDVISTSPASLIADAETATVLIEMLQVL